MSADDKMHATKVNEMQGLDDDEEGEAPVREPWKNPALLRAMMKEAQQEALLAEVNPELPVP